MLNKQQVSHWISFSAIPLAIIWFFVERSIEPIIVGLYGVNSIIGLGMPWNYRKYASKRNKGTVSFNFNKNGKKYEFGSDATHFEIEWSSSDANSIQAYGRTPSVRKVAVVSDKASISDISDASSYEYTDHERPQKGEILLLKNRFNNYAALKIIDIKDRSRDSDVDELTIEYVINPEGITDFR
jgi:hypothetical protein